MGMLAWRQKSWTSLTSPAAEAAFRHRDERLIPAEVTASRRKSSSVPLNSREIEALDVLVEKNTQAHSDIMHSVVCWCYFEVSLHSELLSSEFWFKQNTTLKTFCSHFFFFYFFASFRVLQLNSVLMFQITSKARVRALINPMHIRS